MKRILIALLLIATAASAQIGSGFKGRGGNASVSSTLPIIADSTLWHLQGTDTLVTDGALPVKVSGLRVSGTTRLDGTLTLVTTAGGPRLSMKAVDGDTLVITLDGTYTILKTSAHLVMDGATYGYMRVGGTSAYRWDINNFIPYITDAKTLGASTEKWQTYYGSDNIYLGGKSQTATMYVSGENTIAGSDSSWTMSAVNGVPKLEAKFALPAASYSNGGRRTYFGADTLALFNGAKTGRDSTTYVLPSGKLVAATLQIGASNFTTTKIDTVFTAGYVPRWVKFTSGAKSWYSPVYADTTGKW